MEWRRRGNDEGEGEIWRDWEWSGEGKMKGKERFGGSESGVEKERER